MVLRQDATQRWLGAGIKEIEESQPPCRPDWSRDSLRLRHRGDLEIRAANADTAGAPIILLHAVLTFVPYLRHTNVIQTSRGKV